MKSVWIPKWSYICVKFIFVQSLEGSPGNSFKTEADHSSIEDNVKYEKQNSTRIIQNNIFPPGNIWRYIKTNLLREPHIMQIN